jgi:hypothetical protein
MRTVEFPLSLEGFVEHWTLCDSFQKVCGGAIALALGVLETLGIFRVRSSVTTNIKIRKS